MKRKKASASFAMSWLIVILEVVAMVMAYNELKFSMFRYYTEDSNLLLLITTALWLFFEGRYLRDGVAIPDWARVAKYAATCTTTVTLMVVLTVLAPMEHDYAGLLFSGSMLFVHTLCPLLALVSFLLFEGEPKLHRTDVVIALIPTVLYALVAIILNVVNVWHGPYPFLLVHEQPDWLSFLWCATILGGAWVLAALLRVFNGMIHREYVY